ncbi:CLUMA_CG020292, isoform A [Clunio marinus]|uniref:CLUMA_CG020292, isoform A n=1 Tax=Clunio marinus TaxID=568069 RepID=A0A1J1J8R7_9DIPT|nr:CLUMA_CG020292, isoform A [Clunio marinus]
MNNLRTSLISRLKPYSKYIPQIDKHILRTMLKLCVEVLETKKYSKQAYDKEVLKLTSLHQKDGKEHDYAVYCTAIMILLETFLKFPKKSNENLADILKELKFQGDCVEDLTKVLITNQEHLYEQYKELKTTEPFTQLEHRIDISGVDRGQPPSVILSYEQDGIGKAVNLSLQEFHQLRYMVASALHELQDLERKKS